MAGAFGLLRNPQALAAPSARSFYVNYRALRS